MRLKVSASPACPSAKVFSPAWSGTMNCVLLGVAVGEPQFTRLESFTSVTHSGEVESTVNWYSPGSAVYTDRYAGPVMALAFAVSGPHPYAWQPMFSLVRNY
jgi:hypothetical protein